VRPLRLEAPAALGSLAPIGPYYALVIGITITSNSTNWQTAVGDAKAVAQLLHDLYGFQTKVLFRRDPGRHPGRRLTITSARCQRRPTCLIYLCGHGQKDVAAQRAYWLRWTPNRTTARTGSTPFEITDKLRAIPARHILVIADSCWSGDLTMQCRAGITSIEHDALLVKMLTLKSRHIMSSGGDEPVADERWDGHSVFTGALLQSHGPIWTEITFTARRCSCRSPAACRRRSQQTPEYAILRDSDALTLGDFVFFRSKRTAVTAP